MNYIANNNDIYLPLSFIGYDDQLNLNLFD